MKGNLNLYTIKLILLAVLCFGAALDARAQSSDQSSPTVLTTYEYSGKGPGKERNYFFSFTGGAGEVTVALAIKAKQYSTFARLEIIDAGMNTLAAHNMNAATSTGASQAQKQIALAEKQTVLLKLTLDGNLAEYKITLGGAVEFGDRSGDGTTSKTPPESVENRTTVTTTGIAGNVFKVDIGKFKLGQFINLPKTGTLVIQMNDGSTREIDLQTVRSVTIKKP